MDLKELIKNEKKEKQFAKKGITNTKELLEFFPRKYEDHRNTVTPLDVKDKDICTMILHIEDIRNRRMSVEARCIEKKSGKQVSVVWFNMSFMYQKIINLFNMDVLVSGRYSDGEWGRQFINPTVFTTDIENNLKIVPIYKSIQGMSKDYLDDTIEQALKIEENPEFVSDEVIEHFGIIPQEQLYKMVHRPTSIQDIENAHNRAVFNILYNFAKEMEKKTVGVNKYSSFLPLKLTYCNKTISQLPYDLTNDQKIVIRDIIQKAKNGERINALIQGDVGCGKTITAFLLMIAMADNGYQSVIMAPTGVLAKQHYEELKSLVEPLGFHCVFLSSGLKVVQKKEILNKIKDGTANFIIGTHSCIGKDVIYNNLAMTVVDEEHKFGVKQREMLREKAELGVHSISMSATPIPRSLALSLYSGTIDVYTIKTMPNGRKPIQTYLMQEDSEIFTFLMNEIRNGHQGYIVCPQISSQECDIDNEDKEAPESVKSVYEKVSNYFEPRGVKVVCVTGKAKEEEKTQILEAFSKNEYQILIATTIIEVGVNVPNTTVMAIMSADRFGLAGLHQLRGRVGRSDLQSYCLLKSKDVNNPRLNVMCQTCDGFQIAEQDLKIRGTGELLGTKQSGMNNNVYLMLKYPLLYEEIKKYIHIEDELQL